LNKQPYDVNEQIQDRDKKTFIGFYYAKHVLNLTSQIKSINLIGTIVKIIIIQFMYYKRI